jgi:hypothetical protein
LVVVGLVLALVSLLADAVGVGAAPGLGWKQMVGTAVGIVLVVIGLIGLRGASSGTGEAS